MNYDEFVKDKVNFEKSYGYPVDDSDIHPILLPHQRYHCIDCGYRWHTVGDDGTWTYIEGTGAEA